MSNKTTLFNKQITGTGINLFACAYKKKPKENFSEKQQTNLFVDETREEYYFGASRAIFQNIKIGERLYPSDLRIIYKREPRQPNVIGMFFQSLVKLGVVKKTGDHRRSMARSCKGREEWEYVRVK